MAFCCNSPPIFVEWCLSGSTEYLKRQRFTNIENAVKKFQNIRSTGYLAVNLFILVSDVRVDLLHYEPIKV